MTKIIEVLTKVRPDIVFTAETKIIDDDYLDSLDIIRLVSELESVFDVSISGNDIVPENFNTVNAIQSLVDKSKKS